MRQRSVRAKINFGFLAVACFVAIFVLAAIGIHYATLERASLIEAEHVAEFITERTSDIGLANPGRIEDYIQSLQRHRKRDVFVVDVTRKGVADANADEIGSVYDGDKGGEVGLTIADGVTRTFVEQSEQHPEGARQIVVPLRQRIDASSAAIIGAVVLEYTPIRDELLAAERGQLYLLVGFGAVVIILATLFGSRIARRITAPLRELTAAVTRIASGDYEARVAVTSDDEIGRLSHSFNRMAGDLGTSRAELAAHGRDLEERIASRTEELTAANGLLEVEVGERKVAAERIEYLAYYDSLTTLPNRSRFSQLLNQALSSARPLGESLSVLFVDLDRFKNINDTLGHQAGDLLLQETAKRLKGCVRDGDVVARLGGDEFVVLMPHLVDIAEVEMVAHRILMAASRSFTAIGQEFHVTASIGISSFPKDGDDERTLMKHADIAMYKAKEEGKNNFQFYSEELNANSFERLALESSLRRALERGEFELHYQPKVELQGGTIVGIEALLRWRHPNLGTVAPAKFIPLAEETGLIVSIGKWVLRTACAQNVAWQKRGLPALCMAVNLSPRQFMDEHLLADVTAILRETGMRPDLLELEITESMLMYNVDKAIRILKALRLLGIRLAIDDFGTGYSSLSNLKRFPIDTIKVDRSFVRELPDDAENRGITEAIIAMGKALSLTVIAEGVETREQAEYLRDHACNEYQGFYFSKAVPAEKFAALLEAQAPATKSDLHPAIA